MHSTTHSLRRGFTLIELLVVIAIIGVLSSVVLASLNSARAKARDAERLSDLHQLQTALELYYGDHGYYPKESAGANGKVGEGAGLDAMLAPYLPKIPHDPMGPGNSSYYYYYDGYQSCSGSHGLGQYVSVIFVRNMEMQSGNASEYCSAWGGEGGAGQPGAEHIVLGTASA
jgi:general secretion pathway protein G